MITKDSNELIFSKNIFTELINYINSKSFEKELLDIFYLEVVALKNGNQNVPEEYSAIKNEKELLKYLYQEDELNFYFIYNIFSKHLTLSYIKKDSEDKAFNIKFFNRKLLAPTISKTVWPYLVSQSDYNKEMLLNNFRKSMINQVKDHQKFIIDYTQEHDVTVNQASGSIKKFFGASLFDFKYFRDLAANSIKDALNYVNQFQVKNSGWKELENKILHEIVLDKKHQNEWKNIFLTAFGEEITTLQSEVMNSLYFQSDFMLRFYANNQENFIDTLTSLFGEDFYNKRVYTIFIYALSFKLSSGYIHENDYETNKLVEILYRKNNLFFINNYLPEIKKENKRFSDDSGMGFLLGYVNNKKLTGIDWSILIPTYSVNDLVHPFNKAYKNAFPYLNYNNFNFSDEILSFSKKEIYMLIGQLMNKNNHNDSTSNLIILRLKELI